MNKGAPENSEGLAALYTFGNTGVRPAEGGWPVPLPLCMSPS
jgi:hypothetical protein